MKSACLIAVVSCLLLCCGPFKRAHRVEPKTTAAGEETGRSETGAGYSAEWNAVDARRLAREMMTDCLSGAWIPAYLGVTGNKPLATVGPIRDWTGKGIDAETFGQACEQELSKSEQVSFAPCRRLPEEPGMEGEEKQEFVSPETIGQIKTETGATFILVGAVRSVDEKTAAGSPSYFRVELEMINTRTMARVWSGRGKIGE